MNKDVKKILITLGFYSFACGLFYNFQQLWMADNDLSLKTISTIYSLCALITVSIIFLSSNVIKQDKLKKFTTSLLISKSILMFLLFLLNKSGHSVIIKFIIMMEYALDVEAYTCIYPLITLITKNDKIYAIKSLIYSFIYYVGVLFAGLLLGKNILFLNINYNFYCLFGSISVFISFIVLNKIDFSKYIIDSTKSNTTNHLYELVKIIKKDKVTHNYLMYLLTGNISYFCVTTLMLTILTKNIGYSARYASNFLLALGVISVLLGVLVLHKLTLKNNYINLMIKYGTRFLAYLVAFIIGSNNSLLIAMIFAKVLADSYSHVTDAPYINRFDGDYQLSFCNLKEMVNYFSRAIGTILCGLVITNSPRYIFLFSSIFVFLQLVFGIKALYLKSKEG